MNPFTYFANEAARLRGHTKPTMGDYMVGLLGVFFGVVGVQLMYALTAKNKHPRNVYRWMNVRGSDMWLLIGEQDGAGSKRYIRKPWF